MAFLTWIDTYATVITAISTVITIVSMIQSCRYAKKSKAYSKIAEDAKMALISKESTFSLYRDILPKVKKIDNKIIPLTGINTDGISNDDKEKIYESLQSLLKEINLLIPRIVQSELKSNLERCYKSLNDNSQVILNNNKEELKHLRDLIRNLETVIVNSWTVSLTANA